MAEDKVSEAEAMQNLANAMNNLADRLAKFQDPDWWQIAVGQTFQTMSSVPVLAEAIRQAVPVSLPGVTGISVGISLSEEERQRMTERVYKALSPQIKEFRKFTKKALEELPAAKLKGLVDRVEAGEVAKLEKRRGCVFVTFDSGYDVYLVM